jgi:hypothetical protein
MPGCLEAHQGHAASLATWKPSGICTSISWRLIPSGFAPTHHRCQEVREWKDVAVLLIKRGHEISSHKVMVIEGSQDHCPAAGTLRSKTSAGAVGTGDRWEQWLLPRAKASSWTATRDIPGPRPSVLVPALQGSSLYTAETAAWTRPGWSQAGYCCLNSSTSSVAASSEDLPCCLSAATLACSALR